MYKRQAIIFVSMTLIFLALTLIFAVKIIHSIRVPLSEARDAIVAMSDGDLDRPVTYESRDEVGEISSALKTSQTVLKLSLIHIFSSPSPWQIPPFTSIVVICRKMSILFPIT